jgi:alpha-N-arabinofuranosidase
MTMRVVAKTVLAAVLLGSAAISSGVERLAMTVDGSRTGPPINPYLYGQFTENANNNFYHGGLWSEVLDDRKFYYPVTASEAQGPSRGRWGSINRWTAVGGGDTVTMDTERAYSGDHSTGVSLDPRAPHGIRQTGLGVARTDYLGRIVLAADGDPEVSVSLIWGSGHDDRQAVQLSGIGTEYRTFPLAFACGAVSRTATLEIVATGEGSLLIGAVSLMPADNIRGWRADSIAALRQIGPTMIRLGGNFVSGYEWRDGVGDPDRRPSRWDHAWRMVETNDVGTDEFMALVEILGAEPYNTVNAGFGDAHSAAQWVEYCNGDPSTPMGKLRAENGHPEPYHITWWNIGNEMYGRWQLGTMRPEHYTIKHNLFAKAMRQVDPTIKIVAVGATPAEMGTTGSALHMTGERIAEYGGPADWNAAMLGGCAGNFDALAEHLYPRANQAFDVNQMDFVPVDEPLAWSARRLPNRVKCAVEAWQQYQEMFPDLDMRSIPIALDEWAPGTVGELSSVFLALSSAEAMHELFRNSGWFVMSEFTHLTGLVTIDRVTTGIEPVGRMFELYRRHFGQIPVEVTGNSPQPDVKGLVGLDKPKVPSGSPTYPLDVAAALTEDRSTLTVAIVNPSESEVPIAVSFEGVTLLPRGTLYRIAAPGLYPANEPGRPPEIDIGRIDVSAVPEVLVVPKLSISLYEWPVQR